MNIANSDTPVLLDTASIEVQPFDLPRRARQCEMLRRHAFAMHGSLRSSRGVFGAVPNLAGETLRRDCNAHAADPALHTSTATTRKRCNACSPRQCA